jgi:hypothetical protein
VHRDRRLKGWAWPKSLPTFVLACVAGAVANVAIATGLFEAGTHWALAGLAGAVVSAIWTSAVMQISTGRWR